MFKLTELMLLMILVICEANSNYAIKQKSCQLQHYIFNNAPTPVAPYCPLIDLENKIFLLYDVNPPEGFNLRRDVYIRLAVFARQLQRHNSYFKGLQLILPPWCHLYHWKSQHLEQDSLPWSMFFDLHSLQRYAPILEFNEFLQMTQTVSSTSSHRQVPVYKVLQLTHFEEMFENGVFHDKFEFVHNCSKETHLRGRLLQQPQLVVEQFECVRFQGSASLLEHVLRTVLMPFSSDNPKVIALLNAEIVLHDHWGDQEFWQARRSMRFAAPLVAIAADFRLTHFNSSDATDRVQRPAMWEQERSYRGAKGGDYLCAHVRRGDFVYGREKFTPTLHAVAMQIKQKLQDLKLNTVFLSTDANAFEVKNLKTHMQRARVVRFSAENLQQKALIKDGGIAIVDQLICAHARHFIGTYESTFTYRIYEEREILGFPKRSTFNTFCKSESLENCAKNSVWPVVY